MIRTKEEILKYYSDEGEHVSPIIQDYLNTTPHHIFTDAGQKQPNKAVQQFLDTQEETNEIIKQYLQ